MIQLKQSIQLNSFLAQKIATPRYKPKDTAAVSLNLYKHVSLFENKKLSIEGAKSLSKALASALGKCKASAFLPALQYLVGSNVSPRTLRFLCDQAAASRHTLKRSAPFDLFRGALGFEWAPFKVLDVTQEPGSYTHYVLGEFTDGRPCGLTFALKQSDIGYRFYREAGLPKKLMRGAKLYPKDIVGFNYMALLQYESFFPLDIPNESIKQINPHTISTIRCTETQKTHNKILYKERLTPCPVQKLVNTSCAQCFIGYDTCPRGCRSITNWAANTNPPTEILIHGQRKAKG